MTMGKRTDWSTDHMALAKVYRIFFGDSVEYKNLFQILGWTGSCIEGA